MSATVENTTIANASIGIQLAGKAGVVFHRSRFDNTVTGILNQGTTTVDAIWNWWGSTDGPSAPSKAAPASFVTAAQPSGLRSKVTAGVTYQPWCTSEACDISSDGGPVPVVPESGSVPLVLLTGLATAAIAGALRRRVAGPRRPIERQARSGRGARFSAGGDLSAAVTYPSTDRHATSVDVVRDERQLGNNLPRSTPNGDLH